MVGDFPGVMADNQLSMNEEQSFDFCVCVSF